MNLRSGRMFESGVVEKFGQIAKDLRGKLLVEVILLLIFLTLAIVLSFENVIHHIIDLWSNEHSSDENLKIVIHSLIFFTFISLLLIFIPPLWAKKRKERVQ